MTATFPRGAEADPVAQPALAAHIATQPAHGGDLAGTARPPSGSAGGDLGGAFPSPTVTKAQSGFTIAGIAGATTADLAVVATNTQTANYMLTAGDAGKVVEMNAAGATTVTVPPNSSVAFPIGTIVEVHRYGAGAVTLVAGAGVTIRSNGGLLAVAAQYDTVALRKRATDEWVAVGNLA